MPPKRLHRRPTRLEPRESTTEALAHFVLQITGTLLAIIAVWVFLAGALGITGQLGDGWWGRFLGTIALGAGVGLLVAGKRLAIEHRIMRRRRD